MSHMYSYSATCRQQPAATGMSCLTHPERCCLELASHHQTRCQECPRVLTNSSRTPAVQSWVCRHDGQGASRHCVGCPSRGVFVRVDAVFPSGQPCTIVALWTAVETLVVTWLTIRRAARWADLLCFCEAHLLPAPQFTRGPNRAPCACVVWGGVCMFGPCFVPCACASSFAPSGRIS